MWPFDQNNQQMYQQYAQAYDTGNYYGVDQNQTLGYLEQFLQGAPFDMQQQIYQQHFAQMPYEQRVLMAQQVPPQYAMNPNDPFSMSQSFLRMGHEQPYLLRQIFSHPLLIGAGLGLAGLVAKHMLAHHQQQMYGGQPQYGYNQGGPQYGYNQGGPQYGYNQGPGYGQDQYMQQELNQERREEQELRRELRQEERREERLEERERHHHRDEW